MPRKSALDRAHPGAQTKGFESPPESPKVEPIDRDLIIGKEESLDNPDALRAFWGDFFEAIEEARDEIEERERDSVRWAREKLIR